ncbi:hypothetical protein FQA39_LY02088 [Lamprigera yunnana]|nr:hypothetical protein FQA39_LY02088 [Lamprigera yunnana]
MLTTQFALLNKNMRNSTSKSHEDGLDPATSSSFQVGYRHDSWISSRQTNPPEIPLRFSQSDGTPTVDRRHEDEDLRISKSVSLYDIKKAYRGQAKDLHPDKNKDDPNALQKFQDLEAAYEALLDERKKYDRCVFLETFVFTLVVVESNTTKGANIVMDVLITLEDLYSGTFVEITRNKREMKPPKGTRRCNYRLRERQPLLCGTPHEEDFTKRGITKFITSSLRRKPHSKLLSGTSAYC